MASLALARGPAIAVLMDEFTKNAMGTACGVMGWAPDVFWQATPFDLLNAWHGYETFHGLKPANDLTHADVRELRKILNDLK
ncbi:MAG: phage tail assembly chaperone [Alphaproteobacteria bacterium]|nr:phage tail assembly chaperone [Alphaproteobacteria bacterium]